jgi:hypothetical protein
VLLLKRPDFFCGKIVFSTKGMLLTCYQVYSNVIRTYCLTYVASSGALEWYREHPSVVHLPVGGVGTLDFKIDSQLRDDLERYAECITLDWIKKQFGSDERQLGLRFDNNWRPFYRNRPYVPNILW